MKNRILSDGILTLPIKNCFGLCDLCRAAISIYTLRVVNLGKSSNPVFNMFLQSRKIIIIRFCRLIHGDCGDLCWRSPRGRSIVDKVVKFARGLPQSVNCVVSLIVSHFQLLTGGFPFWLRGVRFQVLITTTLTITDVPKKWLS